MKHPFSVVKDFEDAVAEYCGAPYCVAVNSCTNALFLCLTYIKQLETKIIEETWSGYTWTKDLEINIPKFTYVSIPIQARLAGFNIKFRDENWNGMYKIEPYWLYDSARRFTSGMCENIVNKGESHNYYVCVSFHWSKILGIQQGGAILTNDSDFVGWAKRARFDGRTEGLTPKQDVITMLGWHMYMSPEIAAEGLVRLYHLPKHNPDLPNDDYPDLSKMVIFQ